MVVLTSEADKNFILSRTRNLLNTVFSEVTVGPDLTKRQRAGEVKLKEEAERRNHQLSQQDRANNLKWLVIGKRGEKRLIKAVERDSFRPPPPSTTYNLEPFLNQRGARPKTRPVQYQPLPQHTNPVQAAGAEVISGQIQYQAPNHAPGGQQIPQYQYQAPSQVQAAGSQPRMLQNQASQLGQFARQQQQQHCQYVQSQSEFSRPLGQVQAARIRPTPPTQSSRHDGYRNDAYQENLYLSETDQLDRQTGPQQGDVAQQSTIPGPWPGLIPTQRGRLNSKRRLGGEEEGEAEEGEEEEDSQPNPPRRRRP